MTTSKAPQAYPRAEYLRRLAAVKSEMTRRDLEAMVISSWANVTYLIGNSIRMLAPHALARC